VLLFVIIQRTISISHDYPALAEEKKPLTPSFYTNLIFPNAFTLLTAESFIYMAGSLCYVLIMMAS